MKIAVKPDLKSKGSFVIKSYVHPMEKECNLIDFKFYQKLSVLFISFFIILIFPESARELGNICESYYSKNTCNVW